MAVVQTRRKGMSALRKRRERLSREIGGSRSSILAFRPRVNDKDVEGVGLDNLESGIGVEGPNNHRIRRARRRVTALIVHLRLRSGRTWSSASSMGNTDPSARFGRSESSISHFRPSSTSSISSIALPIRRLTQKGSTIEW